MLTNELFVLILTQIAAVTALVSLYVLLSELATSKSVAVTAALILSLILSIVGDTNISKSIFFTDIMPSGQLVQMEQMEKIADIQRIFPVYSLAVTVVSSAIGVLIFRRKDLK